MIILAVGLIGLIVGSFLTAVIHRLPDLMTIIRERSHCPHCKKELGFWDLIPLLGFVMLAGKCRYCSKKISWQYPLVEFSTGLIFVLIWLNFGLSVYSVFLAIICAGLIVIAAYDLKKMLIPDEILWPLVVLALLYFIARTLIEGSFAILSSAFVGALIFGGIILILHFVSKGKWMGFGDIKLAALLGFILGIPLVFVGFFITFLAGGFLGLVLMAIGKKSLKDKVPFAPFMIIGFLIAIFWGEQLISWYLNIGV